MGGIGTSAGMGAIRAAGTMAAGIVMTGIMTANTTMRHGGFPSLVTNP